MWHVCSHVCAWCCSERCWYFCDWFHCAFGTFGGSWLVGGGLCFHVVCDVFPSLLVFVLFAGVLDAIVAAQTLLAPTLGQPGLQAGRNREAGTVLNTGTGMQAWCRQRWDGKNHDFGVRALRPNL